MNGGLKFGTETCTFGPVTVTSVTPVRRPSSLRERVDLLSRSGPLVSIVDYGSPDSRPGYWSQGTPGLRTYRSTCG